MRIASFIGRTVLSISDQRCVLSNDSVAKNTTSTSPQTSFIVAMSGWLTASVLARMRMWEMVLPIKQA